MDQTTGVERWERSAHERHVMLYADCTLCVIESNGQADRLMDRDAEPAEEQRSATPLVLDTSGDWTGWLDAPEPTCEGYLPDADPQS